MVQQVALRLREAERAHVEQHARQLLDLCTAPGGENQGLLFSVQPAEACPDHILYREERTASAACGRHLACTKTKAGSGVCCEGRPQ